jgi:hypothetical protein
MVPVVVGLGLVAGGGLYGVSALSGGSEGADSPTAAVEQLFVAVDNEDVLGVLDALTPAERNVMVAPMQQMASEFQRLGIAGEGMSLAKIDGVDIDIQGLQLEAEPLTDDIVAVYITGGTISGSIDPGQLPIGDALADVIEEASGEPLGEVESPPIEREDLASDAAIVAIRRNGGWGVSLGYTIAEAARAGSGAPLPSFDGQVAPIGGDTPEAAIEGMMDALDDGDLEAMIGHLDPEEAAALYDYAPLFLDDSAESAEAVRDALDITDLQVKASGAGDRRRVEITAMSANVSVDGDSASLDWDGECLVVESSSETVDTCELDNEPGGIESFGFSQASQGVRLTVHQVDGRWYVSPLGSILDLMVEGLQAADDDYVSDLGGLLGGLGGIVEEPFEPAEPVDPDFGDDFDEDFGDLGEALCVLEESSEDCVEGF